MVPVFQDRAVCLTKFGPESRPNSKENHRVGKTLNVDQGRVLISTSSGGELEKWAPQKR